MIFGERNCLEIEVGNSTRLFDRIWVLFYFVQLSIDDDEIYICQVYNIVLISDFFITLHISS